MFLNKGGRRGKSQGHEAAREKKSIGTAAWGNRIKQQDGQLERILTAKLPIYFLYFFLFL